MEKKVLYETAVAWLRSTINLPQDGSDKLCVAFRGLYHDDPWIAMEVINTEFGTAYTAKRFREWCRRERNPPHKVQEFMRGQVIRSRFDAKTAGQLCQLLDIQLPGEDLV